MTSDKNDLTKKISSLESIAEIFNGRKMIRCGEAILELRGMVANKQPDSLLKKTFSKLNEKFHAEFKGSSSHRAKCFDLVTRMISNAIMTNPKAFHNATTDSLASIKERTGARKSLGKLVSLLTKIEDIDNEGRLMGMSILYLAMIEGLFDEDIRACYVWSKLAVNDSSHVNAYKMSILDIKQHFEDKVFDVCLFEGWNRNLRNAIGHFTYNYDQETEKMIYRDKLADPAWEAGYSLEDMTEIYEKIENVDELIILVLLILSVRDLCFSTTPPWNTPDKL